MNDQNPTSYIEEVAPMPRWGESGVTMEALIRAQLVEAQRLYEWFHHRSHTAFDFQPGDKSAEADHARSKMMTSLLGFMHASTSAALLIEIQRLSPETADEFAVGHVAREESGDFYPEMIWDWLVQRGIDPEKVRAVAEAEIAKDTDR